MKTRCEVYSRVVGYLRPVDSWNDGKVEEYNDRVLFNVSDNGGVQSKTKGIQNSSKDKKEASK